MYNNMKASDKIFRTALYLRLSKEDGDKMESDSIDNQRTYLNDFLDHQSDMTFADEYVDDGYTGTNFNRPAFKRLDEDIENGLIDCVIVKDLSRFGRDYIDIGYYLEKKYPLNDIRFIAINDGIDTIKRQYDISMPIKNVINAEYSRDISRKVNSSFNAKRKAGKFIGAFASYGYIKDDKDHNRLIIDEYAADIVRRIFKEYIEGYGKIRIAKRLNENNIPCPSAYKKLNNQNYYNGHILEGTDYWTYATIHRVLNNEMYIGNMVQGKSYRKVVQGKAENKPRDEWIVVENTHPAIIDRDTWDNVQRLLKTRGRSNGDLMTNLETKQHIFTGLIKCADCGRAMSKNTSHGIIYYVCGTNKRYGKCTRHTIRYDILCQIILNDINKCIEKVEDLDKLIKESKPVPMNNNDRIKAQIKGLQKEYDNVNNKKLGLYDDYKSDLLSKEEYLEHKDRYGRRMEGIKQQIEALEQKLSSMTEENFVNNSWVRKLLSMGKLTELDRNIIVDMIECIEVYEEKHVKITYRFSDDIDVFLDKTLKVNR